MVFLFMDRNYPNRNESCFFSDINNAPNQVIIAQWLARQLATVGPRFKSQQGREWLILIKKEFRMQLWHDKPGFFLFWLKYMLPLGKARLLWVLKTPIYWVQCTKIILRTVNCDVNIRIKATWCHYIKSKFEQQFSELLFWLNILLSEMFHLAKTILWF